MASQLENWEDQWGIVNKRGVILKQEHNNSKQKNELKKIKDKTKHQEAMNHILSEDITKSRGDLKSLKYGEKMRTQQ